MWSRTGKVLWTFRSAGLQGGKSIVWWTAAVVNLSALTGLTVEVEWHWMHWWTARRLKRHQTNIYKFVSNYLQFWRRYAILCTTTQFTAYVQNVHHQPKCTLAFSDIFSKQLGIFGPNFTHLLNVPIYARLQTFVQLSPTMTKLCHIKCDHPVCVSTDGGHFEHIALMVVGLNMA